MQGVQATVKIVPYGSLRRSLPVSAGGTLDHPLADARSLADVLASLDVRTEQVQLAMVNHRAAAVDSAVCAGDRIALFPKEYPIFADWQSYRRPLKA